MEVLRRVCPQEEAEIKEMQKRQRELHLVPTPVCYLGLEVFDGGGEKVAEYQDRSKSWTRNWYNFIVNQAMQMVPNTLGTTFGAGSIMFKNTDGNLAGSSTMCYMASISSNNGHRGAGGNNQYGVVVGIGTGAESFEGHALGTRIAHGTGSGQLSYGDTPLLTAIWDNTMKKFIQNIERSFLNFSGASIVVNEVGLYCGLSITTSMTARDLLSPGVSVPHDGLLKVKYTQEITYPV